MGTQTSGLSLKHPFAQLEKWGQCYATAPTIRFVSSGQIVSELSCRPPSLSPLTSLVSEVLNVWLRVGKTQFFLLCLALLCNVSVRRVPPQAPIFFLAALQEK